MHPFIANKENKVYQGCDKWNANYPTRHQNDSKHEDCVKFYLCEKYGGPSPIENVVNDLNEKLDSKRHQEAQKPFRICRSQNTKHYANYSS